MTPRSTYLKRREKIAEFLDTKVERKYFDMSLVKQGAFPELKCGSAACVAGWAQVVFQEEYKASNRIGLQFIEDILGLTSGETRGLVSPTAKHQTPKAAAKYIRKHLME